MVQRKVSYCKLGIQGITSSNALTTHKIHDSNIKPSSNQNNHHDHHISTTTIGADFKPIKMKKSRSIRRSDVDISLRLPLRIRDTPPHPGKSSCSPNYMKSTRSFEARREDTAGVASTRSISGTSKAAKTLTNLSSFKKARLKLKQPARTAERTCSSAQKDSKFPPVLELNPGATEAKGKSVVRVCKYNHCSLNDHHHKSAPPLKRFVFLRRRLLRAEKTTQRPVLSPRTKRLSECKGGGGGGDDQHEEFFVEIHVPDRGVDQQVSESLSDGPCSEIDLQDERQQTEEGTKSSDLKVTPKDEDYPPTPVQSDRLSLSLDEFICENSELEWEEGHVLTAKEIHETDEIYIQKNYNDDQGKPGFDTEDSNDGYFDEGHFDEGHEYPAYFYDEVVEYLCFSDAYSLPDSESTKTGEREDCTLEDESTIRAAEVQEESIDNQGRVCYELTEEITAVANEDLDSYQDPVQTEGDESNEGDCVIGETREENSADNPRVAENLETSNSTANNSDREGDESSDDNCIVGETREENSADQPRMTVDLENTISKANNSAQEGSQSNEDDCIIEENRADNSDDITRMTENSETSFCTANKNDQDSTDQSDEENSAEEILSSEVKLESNGSNVVEVNTSSFKGKSDFNDELLESCSKLRKGMRYKKDGEDAEEEREFNPRGPNFLELEPEPEAEKVDLRHQELDDRKNAEDWMIDFALQKTVNQLTPARKKKVALLVEAYETVLPVPKHESDARRDSLVL